MIDFLERLITITNPDELHILAETALPELPFHLYSKDRKGIFLHCNDATARTAGYDSANELRGCTDYDLCLPATAAAVSSVDASIIYSGQPQLLIENVKLLNGREFSTFSFKLPLRTEMAKISGIFGLSFVIKQEKLLAYIDQIADINHPCAESIHTAHGKQILTYRQQECLFYLVKGMTIKQIASELTLSPRTIEHHIESIKNKLQCHSRSELIAKALQQSFIRARLSQL